MEVPFSFFKKNKLSELAQRRAELIRRAEIQRQSLALMYHQLEHPMHWMDYGISAGRLLKKGSITLPLIIGLLTRFLPQRLAILQKASKWPVRIMEAWGIFKQARNFIARHPFTE